MEGEFFIVRQDKTMPSYVFSTKEEAEGCCDIVGESDNTEIVHVIEMSHFLKLEDRLKKFEGALNKIGMLSMSGMAYTKEFTERVETITREVLGVEKKWPY